MFAAYYRDRAGVAFAHIAIVVLLLIVGIFAHGLLSFIGFVGGIGAALYFAYRVVQAANVAPPSYTGAPFTSDPVAPSAPPSTGGYGYTPGAPGYAPPPSSAYAPPPAYAQPPSTSNTMGDLAMGAMAGMALESVLHSHRHETDVDRGIPVSSVGQSGSTMAPISSSDLDRQQSSPWANQGSQSGAFLPPETPTPTNSDPAFLAPEDSTPSNQGSSFLAPEQPAPSGQDSAFLTPSEPDNRGSGSAFMTPEEPSPDKSYDSAFSEPVSSQDLDHDDPAPTYDAPDTGGGWDGGSSSSDNSGSWGGE